jgi:hypothetical protein
LVDLEKRAANYVSLGRLKLALKSLEYVGNARVPSGSPVRVAVLGFGDKGVESARKLVRLLLLDPLGRVGEWEGMLSGGDGRAVLVRYGEDGESSTSNALLRTIFCPSPLLGKNNIELLISSLDVDVSYANAQDADCSERVVDAMLVPRLEARTEVPGGFSSVAYPVHKTLLLGDGLQDLVSYGRFTAGLAGKSNDNILLQDMLKLAVNTTTPSQEQLPANSLQNASNELSLVDLPLAESAVAKFRESIENGVFFEQAWFRSNIEDITTWITRDSNSRTNLRPPIKTLIFSILAGASSRISAAEAAQRSEATQRSVSPQVRADIMASLDKWAEQAHAELRDSLELAFASKHWGRLKWWKLIWRVDDVGMIADEILDRRWLVRAEKDIIFVAGRIREAGFLDSPSPYDPPSPSVSEEVEDTSTSIQELKLGDLARSTINAADQGQILLDLHTTTAYPPHIPAARLRLSKITIPPLQSLAQSLVLQSLSTAALSTTISALAYVSVSSTSLLEAGTVGAFGFVLALRRLQGGWESARVKWREEVCEEGRRALKGTEERVRQVVVKGGRGAVDEVLVEDLRAARAAVGGVEDALSRMGE